LAKEVTGWRERGAPSLPNTLLGFQHPRSSNRRKIEDLNKIWTNRWDNSVHCPPSQAAGGPKPDGLAKI
jgi:hypothetical protein